MSFWNSSQDRQNRINACLGSFNPQKFTVTVDDSHDLMRYRLAATALWGQSVGLPSFFLTCAEYVIKNHKKLKEVRRTILQAERELRKKKRREKIAEDKARKEAMARWKG
jgi:hypothetical protein